MEDFKYWVDRILREAGIELGTTNNEGVIAKIEARANMLLATQMRELRERIYGLQVPVENEASKEAIAINGTLKKILALLHESSS